MWDGESWKLKGNGFRISVGEPIKSRDCAEEDRREFGIQIGACRATESKSSSDVSNQIWMGFIYTYT